MVTVTIYHDSDENILGFTVKGHAGAGTEGHDIVCAAVSAVAYTALGSLQELAKVNVTDAKIEDGYMEFLTKQDDVPEGTWEERKDLISIIFAVMEIGFLQIEASYSEYTKVEYKEV